MRIKPSAFFKPISVDKQSIRKLLVLACYGSLPWQTVTVNRQLWWSNWLLIRRWWQWWPCACTARTITTCTTFRVIGACHGEPLPDDSGKQEKENVDAKDPNGLLPQTLEDWFESQIQVQEWWIPVSITYCSSYLVKFFKHSLRTYKQSVKAVQRVE